MIVDFDMDNDIEISNERSLHYFCVLVESCIYNEVEENNNSIPPGIS